MPDLLLASALRDDETAVVLLLHQSSVYEISHQIMSSFLVLVFLLHLIDLLLEHFVLLHCIVDLLFLQLLSLFLDCDLLSGSSSLAPLLEQVGRHSLGSYRFHDRLEELVSKSTYCSRRWNRGRSWPSEDPFGS